MTVSPGLGWDDATVLGTVGDGPWWNNFNTGDGVFPADAQWIWSSDGNNHNGPGHARTLNRYQRSPVVDRFSMAVLYDCTGSLTAHFGGFRPGQMCSVVSRLTAK
jgi:hypothetical protein